jgi:hypothetical protein
MHFSISIAMCKHQKTDALARLKPTIFVSGASEKVYIPISSSIYAITYVCMYVCLYVQGA